MSNIAAVTDNLLVEANEIFVDNLASGISAGATTVPMLSLSEYADGKNVVLTVDPGTASQATFTGEKQGASVINAKWTEGNVGASHSAGATVIDYDSATHYNMLRKAVEAHTNEDGTLKTTAVQAALNISSAVPADYTPLAITPTVTAANIAKEIVLTYTGVDYTDRLQEGSKLRIPRSTIPGLQSLGLVAASSQYLSRTPAVYSFTVWTAEAMVKLNTGTASWIVGQDNLSNQGWAVSIYANGQVEAYYRGSGGTRVGTTTTSLLGNRWVHVAATFNPATQTIVVYIDGNPVTITMSGTATTLVHSTNPLSVGGRSGGSYLDGNIHQLRIWNTIRTQAQILDNMGKDLVGNEAGLVGLWKLSNSLNDSTTNAFHLTANGGAATTATDSAFKAVEFAVATKVVKVGSDTLVTAYMGQGFVPRDVLLATSYSSVDKPFGFPASRDYWDFYTILRYDAGINPSDAAWHNAVIGSPMIDVPIGKWEVGYEGTAGGYNTSTSSVDIFVALSKSISSSDDDLLMNWINVEVGAAGVRALRALVTRSKAITAIATTRYYLIAKSASAVDDLRLYGNITPFVVKAKFLLV